MMWRGQKKKGGCVSLCHGRKKARGGDPKLVAAPTKPTAAGINWGAWAPGLDSPGWTAASSAYQQGGREQPTSSQVGERRERLQVTTRCLLPATSTRRPPPNNARLPPCLATRPLQQHQPNASKPTRHVRVEDDSKGRGCQMPLGAAWAVDFKGLPAAGRAEASGGEEETCDALRLGDVEPLSRQLALGLSIDLAERACIVSPKNQPQTRRPRCTPLRDASARAPPRIARRWVVEFPTQKS